MFCIYISLLLLLCTETSQGVTLRKEEESILRSLISEFEKDPTNDRFDHVIQLGIAKRNALPKVFIWCPLKHFRINVYCPIHKSPLVFHSWNADLESRSFNEPRLVYDLHGNIVLVQSMYRCPFKNPDQQSHRVGHIYRSASVEILRSIPRTIENSFPFQLSHRTACSQELLDYLVVHIGRGQNFLELTEDIMSMHFRKFLQSRSPDCDSVDLNEFYTSPLYSVPSNDQLMHIFLAYYDSVSSIFENEILKTQCSILTCDHTFKVSKHIGVTRGEDSAFVNQFENLFIGLNENGEVVAWRLTKSTSFREVQDTLTELKNRLSASGKLLNMVVVDDCCSVRASYKSVFPEAVVKLDLYHACQRVVKTLSKGLPKTQQLSKEFGLIFRANGDTGPERERATPDEETIESNLEMFLKKWECQLPVATIESIKNLRKHIRKGCCSAIPAGAGTQRNERLHKSLKRSLLGGASTVSPELAVAVFSIVLYFWSYKRKPGVTKHMSNARVIPLAPIELYGKNKNISKEIMRAFHCNTSQTELSSTMDRQRSLPLNYKNSTMVHVQASEVVEISELKNDSVLSLVISRAIHLKEVFSSIESMCITRDFNIYEFPFTNKRSLIDVIVKENDNIYDEYGLESDMNMECLQRNLAPFGLKLESVPGNGDCCFVSIVKETNKLMLSNDENNAEFRRHLDRLGFQASLNEDTKLLRSLFCQEIEEHIEQYRNFVDFDINEELSKFSVSGWFNSSLGDLCVLACSNLLQTSIVLITSIPGTPFIPFVP